MQPQLLDRDAFRDAVLSRDGFKCVVCGKTDKLDAHHIMERRLFPDGGYYVDNGVTLCDPDCHMKAEQTLYPVEYLREIAGIRSVVLPPHLYSDERYDKWGNPFLPSGLRIRGELFDDESVQKVLQFVLREFTKYVKYPRTYHFPWSPGIDKDDRVVNMDTSMFCFGTSVVVTEKRDGENTTLYNDYIHARSIDYKPHLSRHRVKAIWGNMAHNIPDGWRVCGENLYAKHSIAYNDLRGYFEMFSIWNDKNECLNWDTTKEWADLLGLPMVPELYRGPWDEHLIKTLAEDVVANGGEGIVVRVAQLFEYRSFRACVGKYVRKEHVQTHGGFMRMQVIPNHLQVK